MADPRDELIDVDGYRTSIRVTGTGGPCIVFDACSGGGHDLWEQVRDGLGETLCLTYARPGLEDSDPLPPALQASVRTTAPAAARLRAVLREAGLQGPYILVGSSIGGYIVDRFLANWPADVAGIVQVDPTYLDVIPRMARDGDIDDADGSGYRWSWPLSMREMQQTPPSTPPHAVVLSRAMGTLPAEIVARAWQPLTVDEADTGWRECQRDWADRLDAVHIAADTAGHLISRDQPELVAAAVRAIHRAVTSGARQLDTTSITDAGGALLPRRPS
ncbi:alpha/beta fold hydrolase [Pseudonocardia pini]|uniref:alpha/beta fold hydrolase n=1 Tax=Pseudonocardia pini TaxID=2758030 RepID=UPI0015F10D90|nr:alpha/beta hydrolase [Pseudonocardia pini]